jgi:hypothetical protein
MTPDEQKERAGLVEWLESAPGEGWSKGQHFHPVPAVNAGWARYQHGELCAYSYGFFSLKDDEEYVTTWATNTTAYRYIANADHPQERTCA